jgi:hypothetical protein
VEGLPTVGVFYSKISANCVLNHVCNNIYAIVVMGLCYLCCVYNCVYELCINMYKMYVIMQCYPLA